MNTNCLRGMKCPQCECEGPFRIEVKATVIMSDDGIEDIGDSDWGDDDWCICEKCKFTDKVRVFRGCRDPLEVCRELVRAYKEGKLDGGVEWENLDDVHRKALEVVEGHGLTMVVAECGHAVFDDELIMEIDGGTTTTCCRDCHQRIN